jgi:type IV pilus biogenesis protein CpaD/CtpE
MTIDLRLLTLPAAALLLAGCEHGIGKDAAAASSFGEANRQTMMAQVVDPDPQYDEPLTTHAEHAGQAVDRYRKDKVKKPDRTSSTVGSGGGS